MGRVNSSCENSSIEDRGVFRKPFRTIRCSTPAERIALIELHRPEALNTINRAMIDELGEAIDACRHDRSVRVILIAGNRKSFCAGADVKAMLGFSADDAKQFALDMKRLHDRIIHCPKPVIAVIEGVCFGGGFELALTCDLRILGPDARIALPETRLGLIPGAGGTQRLLDIVGPAVAAQMILTGEAISAQRAFQLNLAGMLSEQPMEDALRLAERLANGSAPALAAAKSLLNGLRNRNMEPQLEQELSAFAELFRHADSAEGIRAFTEKRQPVFQQEG